MKKLLYVITMIINALGSLCTMSLFIFAGQFCFQNLFLILIGSVIFITSFTVTMLDYNNSFRTHVYRRMPCLTNDVDYRKYFVLRKADFTV